jgi:hypothetical protein
MPCQIYKTIHQDPLGGAKNYEPRQTGILLIKHGTRGSVFEISAQILLHHNEAFPLLLVPQRGMATAEERD